MIKVVFEKGCFDEFTGTQEELDELVAEITRLAESGEILKHVLPVKSDSDEFAAEGVVTIPPRTLH